MNLSRRAALIGASAIFAASGAQAQNFPTRPVRLIVPIAPGGANDIIARMIAERLAPVLGQPVVVDNRPGAGGNLGALAVVGIRCFSPRPMCWWQTSICIARKCRLIRCAIWRPSRALLWVASYWW